MKVLITEYVLSTYYGDNSIIDLMPEAIAMVRSLVRSLIVSRAYVGVTISPFISSSLLPINGNVIRVDPHDYFNEVKRVSGDFDYVIAIAPPRELIKVVDVIDDGKLLQPPKNLIKLFSNKYDAIKELSKCGFRVPKTELITSNDVNNHVQQFHSPAVVKPTYLAGSECVYLVNNDYELRRALAYAINCDPNGMAVLQEFINGVHGSISIVYGVNGPLFYSLNLQLIKNDAGSLHFIGGILPIRKRELQREVEGLVHGIFSCYPELRGYVGLDVVWNDGGIHIIEVNPRPTTSIAGIVSLYPGFGRHILNAHSKDAMGTIFLGDAVNGYAYYVLYDNDSEKNLGTDDIDREVISVFQRKLEIGKTNDLIKIYQRIKPLLSNLVYDINSILH